LEGAALYLQLRNPPDPTAELVDDKFREWLRWARSESIVTGDTYFYRSLDDVIDCPEPVWVVTPKTNALTNGGTRYILRQSDGHILAGFYHRGE